jgi:branched-chain amino acid aminotransferase
MTVFLHGRFVPEAEATVSVFDRSFMYGDGLFETIRVYGGRPFRWTQHLERLRAGAKFLGLPVPFSDLSLHTAAAELIARNRAPESLLRITLSRGVGPRGYSPKGADQPRLVMSVHPAVANNLDHPVRWRLFTASFRVPAGEKLATFKTANKLAQILAKAEAEENGADEALLLNTEGRLAEAASSNCFWVEQGRVCTTPLSEGLLAGVTRAFVLELAHKLGVGTAERSCPARHLLEAEGVFLTLSSLEIVPALSLDGQALRQSPLIRRLHEAYRAAVAAETAGDDADGRPVT